jgi:hypothetical protein
MIIMPKMKQAEALKIADASLQLSKITEENAQLEKEMAELKQSLSHEIKKSTPFHRKT